MTEDYKYWEKRPKDDERKDWRNGCDTWIGEYWKSRNHPHRSLIISAIEKFSIVKSLLEIGCNCGPNLANIKEAFPGITLAGIDANQHAITRGRRSIKDVDFTLGDLLHLPWPDKSFDIVLSDAVLMYVGRKDAPTAIMEMERVCRRGIILIEWLSPSLMGSIINHHWARNYPELLKRLKFKVETYELTKADWPHDTWVKNGRLFIAHRA